eukprot:COSAG01_NODE_1_length_100484_cov_170.446142_19_plen_239_part_00
MDKEDRFNEDLEQARISYQLDVEIYSPRDLRENSKPEKDISPQYNTSLHKQFMYELLKIKDYKLAYDVYQSDVNLGMKHQDKVNQYMADLSDRHDLKVKKEAVKPIDMVSIMKELLEDDEPPPPPISLEEPVLPSVKKVPKEEKIKVRKPRKVAKKRKQSKKVKKAAKEAAVIIESTEKKEEKIKVKKPRKAAKKRKQSKKVKKALKEKALKQTIKLPSEYQGMAKNMGDLLKGMKMM